jgi:hypothetical protein
MDAMPQVISAREPPQIIYVPPPEHDMTAFLWAVLTFALFVAAISMMCGGSFLAAGVFLVGAALAQVLRRWLHRRYLRQRAAQLQDWPGGVPPVATPILRDWAARHLPPKARRIEELVGEYEPPASGARVLCLGKPAIPVVGELRFEPRVLSPTDILWRRLHGAVPILIVAAWYGLSQLGFVRRPDIFVWLMVWSGALVVAVWIWKSGVRPTFVRLAPGIVQFLAYGPAGKTPRVQSYPMSVGTLVVVQAKPPVFTFRRNGLENRLDLQFVRRRQDAELAVWNALLSTAPIPQMSETELVG